MEKAPTQCPVNKSVFMKKTKTGNHEMKSFRQQQQEETGKMHRRRRRNLPERGTSAAVQIPMASSDRRPLPLQLLFLVLLVFCTSPTAAFRSTSVGSSSLSLPRTAGRSPCSMGFDGCWYLLCSPCRYRRCGLCSLPSNLYSSYSFILISMRVVRKKWIGAESLGDRDSFARVRSLSTLKSESA